MDLIVGTTYSSPRLGRYVRVMFMNFDQLFGVYTLDILWIDKDDHTDVEIDHIKVDKSDTKDWTEVKI